MEGTVIRKIFDRRLKNSGTPKIPPIPRRSEIKLTLLDPRPPEKKRRQTPSVFFWRAFESHIESAADVLAPSCLVGSVTGLIGDKYGVISPINFPLYPQKNAFRVARTPTPRQHARREFFLCPSPQRCTKSSALVDRSPPIVNIRIINIVTH